MRPKALCGMMIGHTEHNEEKLMTTEPREETVALEETTVTEDTATTDAAPASDDATAGE